MARHLHGCRDPSPAGANRAHVPEPGRDCRSTLTTRRGRRLSHCEGATSAPRRRLSATGPLSDRQAPMTLAVPLDAERRAALRRMKTFAAGLLVGAAVLYVVARTWENQPDAPALAGYLRAAAEAGMVGGLADWFAVTALFRHPLGLPIPHTAIIPTRKDQIGQALGNFVGTHFLSEQAVRDRIGSAQISRRIGGWLTRPDNAERVANEVAAAARAGIG